MNMRRVEQVLTAAPASDGAGVQLYRIVGPQGMHQLDPFLMLDDFGAGAHSGPIPGFPPHPHRGFETVTYMLEGEMIHEDHLGHRGYLAPGEVQWMTAGRGVIHSEMPRHPEGGAMHGLQLWVNLPAAEKMKPAAYRHLTADTMPVVDFGAGAQVRVIAGTLEKDGERIEGPAQGIATDPLYLDLCLEAHASLTLPVEPERRTLLYVFQGDLMIDGTPIRHRQMAVMGAGDTVSITAGEQDTRALLLAARPLDEPIAHYGPFVMNTREEILKAIADYENGRLTA